MRVTFLTTLAVCAVTASATAQPRTAFPDKRGLAAGRSPAHRQAGRQRLRLRRHPSASGMPTVSLFVIGNDGVLLADGQANPEATQQLLDAIAKVTTKPVKWYVVGSDHGDHTAGNSVLPKDITYIVSAASKATDGSATRRPRNRLACVVVPPAAMTGDKQVIDVGGIEVQVLILGRAHTGGDLSVYLPEAEASSS